MMKSSLALTLGLAAMPQASGAATPWYWGIWCDTAHKTDPAMNFDAWGFGDSEHMVCSWIGAPQSEGDVDALATCEGVYVWDDGTVHRLDKTQLRLRMSHKVADKMILQFDDDLPSEYTLCGIQ